MKKQKIFTASLGLIGLAFIKSANATSINVNAPGYRESEQLRDALDIFLFFLTQGVWVLSIIITIYALIRYVHAFRIKASAKFPHFAKLTRNGLHTALLIIISSLLVSIANPNLRSIWPTSKVAVVVMYLLGYFSPLLFALVPVIISLLVWEAVYKKTKRLITTMIAVGLGWGIIIWMASRALF